MAQDHAGGSRPYGRAVPVSDDGTQSPGTEGKGGITGKDILKDLCKT